MRYLKIVVAYDGTDFNGWQFQPGCRSVQEVLEKAVERVTGSFSRVIGSGRTDAGVHALGQVASFPTPSSIPISNFVRAVNVELPDDLRVLAAEEAPYRFHAIRESTGKRYRYTIQNGRILDVMLGRYAWFVPRELDVDLMQRAADYLRGPLDCACFQNVGSVRKSTVRNIKDITFAVSQAPTTGLRIDIEIEANGFLYNMCRNIVGTLVKIGHKKATPEWILDLIAKGSRTDAGQTAPAKGLCLVAVRYDKPDNSLVHERRNQESVEVERDENIEALYEESDE